MGFALCSLREKPQAFQYEPHLTINNMLTKLIHFISFTAILFITNIACLIHIITPFGLWRRRNQGVGKKTYSRTWKPHITIFEKGYVRDYYFPFFFKHASNDYLDCSTYVNVLFQLLYGISSGRFVSSIKVKEIRLFNIKSVKIVFYKELS